MVLLARGLPASEQMRIWQTFCAQDIIYSARRPACNPQCHIELFRRRMKYVAFDFAKSQGRMMHVQATIKRMRWHVRASHGM